MQTPRSRACRLECQSTWNSLGPHQAIKPITRQSSTEASAPVRRRLIPAHGVYDGVKVDETAAACERVFRVNRKFRAQDVTFEDRFRVITAAPREQGNEVGKRAHDLCRRHRDCVPTIDEAFAVRAGRCIECALLRR